MKHTQKMMDTVQDCYQAVLTATTKWNEYRRLAGMVGIRTAPLPEVAKAASVCTDAAALLERRKNDLQRELFGKEIPQVTFYATDAFGNTIGRKVVVSLPDARHATPYISGAVYDALVAMFGHNLRTDAPYAIIVDKRNVTIAADNTSE